MCNIAGYIGSRKASPILIELLRKQEGLDGGYYSGIATMEHGQIRYEKVVGNVATLLQTTDCLALPGTIGIAHTRTPGDTGREWAHPFVCENDGMIETAFLLNGSIGCFYDREKAYEKIAEELIAEGYLMKSIVPSNGKSLSLSNGNRVHLSEVLCKYITRKIRQGKDTIEAMKETYIEMPKEIVGLLISVTEENSITWARMNCPIFAGYASHGIYIASTPQSFPNDVLKIETLPAMSVGRVYQNEITYKEFCEKPGTVAVYDENTVECARIIIEKELSYGRKTFPDLREKIVHLFKEADMTTAGELTYKILFDIQKQEKLKEEIVYLPGVYDGLYAPVTLMSLI